METVYIEMTMVSYLVANPHRDPILAAHQQLTRQWWQDQRSAYHCLVSDETLTEAARGDVEQARLRLGALQGLPVLPITAEVEALADAVLQSGSLPSAARSDASHVFGGHAGRCRFPADVELPAARQPASPEATPGAHDGARSYPAGDLHTD